MTEANVSLAEALAIESEQWYRNLANSHGAAPCAFTGVTQDGTQFSTILNDFPLTQPFQGQMRAFLQWLCWKECVVAYAYANRFGGADGALWVLIVADDGDNIVEAMMPIVERDDGGTTCRGTGHFKPGR